jgi:hypothetical protein
MGACMLKEVTTKNGEQINQTPTIIIANTGSELK